MKKVIILAALTAIAGGASANLLIDGGFEMGDLNAPQFLGGPWTTQYGYASNNNPAQNDPASIWHEGNMRVMEGLSANNALTGHTLWDSVVANEGRSFLAVNGATNTENHPFVLNQDFTLATVSQIALSFASVNLYIPDVNGSSTIQIYLDNVLIGSTNTQLDNIWRTSTFLTTASAGLHTFTLLATTTQASGNDFGLDNLSVEAVPEPFTMALMATAALAGFGKMRRRTINPVCA